MNPNTAKPPSLAERIRAKLEQGQGAEALKSLASSQPSEPAPPAQQQAAIAIVKSQQCLLLDCSSSMSEEVEPGRSKWQALKELLPQFFGTRRFAFADDCQAVQVLPHPAGTTDMAGAFVTIKRAGVRHAVLITDGLPNSASAALREAAGLRLDIFYVGPGPRPAFLDKLAAATGGTAHTGTLAKRGQGKLIGSVKQILALPPGERK